MKTPFYLFLGESDRDSATSKLKASGVGYRKKRLESKVENWEVILKIMESPELIGTLTKLTNTAYEYLADDKYLTIATKIIEKMARTPYIIFAHESLLTGVPTSEVRTDESIDYFGIESFFTPPREGVLDFVTALFERYNLIVTPYKTNAELSVLASSFLDENEKNLVFRIYIPSGRMWITEAERLLQLFRDYLNNVSGLRVSHEQYSTKQGVVHEFFADKSLDISILPNEYTEFTETFELALSEPNRAVAMLTKRGIAARTIQTIVDRYTKEARRLHIDLKQERERRFLSIRHRLEDELTEITDPSVWNDIYQIIESSLPTVGGASNTIGVISGAFPAASTVAHTLNIDYSPQIVNSVGGIVAQEISGNSHIGVEAVQLLKEIQKFAGTRAGELTSSLHELMDPDAKKEDRFSAKQKLKSFLIGASKKIGDVAAGVLQSYIEKQIGL